MFKRFKGIRSVKYHHVFWATVFVVVASSPAALATERSGPLEEIVVTASPVARPRLEIVQATSVLSGAALTDALRTSLGETLAGEPGVSSTFFGPVASRPIIRGLDGDRVRILSNGLDVVDVSSISPDHQVSQEMLNVRRIEVLRGPSSLLYGTGAVGGVVNIVDRRVPESAPKNGREGAMVGAYASAAREGQAGGYADFALGPKLALHLDGLVRDGEDYRAPGFSSPDAEQLGIQGRVPNSAAKSHQYGAGSAVLFDGGYLGVAYSRLDSDYGSPAEPGLIAEDPGQDPAAVRIGLDQHRYEMRGEIRDLGAMIKRLEVKGAITDYMHTEFEGDEAGTTFESDGRELRADLTHRKIGGLTGVFGLQWRERDVSAIGDEAFLPPTETRQIAPFIVEDYEVGPVIVQGGARFEHTRIVNKAANVKRSFSSIALSLAANYEVHPDVFLGAMGSWTERPPVAEELFANGPHLATNQFEVGDATLGEEETHYLELSLKAQSGPMTFAGHLFRSIHRGYVFARETGEIEDDLPVYQFTGVKARFYGAEFEVDWLVLDAADWRINLGGALDVVRARDLTNDQPLPRIPPLQYRVALDVARNIVSARIELAGASRQNRIAPLETPTDGYDMLNAQLGVTPWGAQGLSLTLQGRNLTNVRARPHTSFIKDAALLPGRDIRLIARAPF